MKTKNTEIKTLTNYEQQFIIAATAGVPVKVTVGSRNGELYATAGVPIKVEIA